MCKDFIPIQPDEIGENQPFIFISYSRKDLKNIQVILKILRKNHFRFWYDVGVQSGSEWAETLGKKIQTCKQFLVLLSPNAAASKFVKKEIHMAVNVRKEDEICVVYLQDTLLSDGMHLLLDDIQALYKNKLAEWEFEKALCKAVDKCTYFFPETKEIGKAKRQLLDNYDLICELERGGVGTVSLARHKRSGILMIVKSVHFDCTSYAGLFLKIAFENEKEILTYLTKNSCPFVPALMDWFSDEEHIFLVESYIQGKTLESLGNEKGKSGYTEKDVVVIATKILVILEILRKQGIVHGDIKPANLIKNDTGIYLIDFNLARQEGEECVRGGTPGFSAPEQFFRENNDTKAKCVLDLYSLGRTLEWLLISYEAISPNRGPLRYYRRDISPALEAILEKMTCRQAGDRYQSAEEVADVIKNYKNICFWKKAVMRRSSNQTIRKYLKQRRKSVKIRKEPSDLYRNISQTTILIAEEKTTSELH